MDIALEMILEVVCSGTGHVLLWLTRLGRWSVVKKYEETAATVLGLAFWASVLALVAYLFVL